MPMAELTDARISYEITGNGDPLLLVPGRGVEPGTMFELTDGRKVDWANELIDKLASMQKADGSFVNEKASRWSEGNPHLATAYALLALQHARK